MNKNVRVTYLHAIAQNYKMVIYLLALDPDQTLLSAV